MDSPRTTTIGNYDYEEVCKHGFFIKSPPVHLFTNQTSWKRRYFILSKSSKNGYVLRYLKGQQIKGCIEINETSKIEIGICDSEKMAVVKKMFKCMFTEVMTIRTENRDFYLIGTDSKVIEDWATFLFTTCSEKEMETTALLAHEETEDKGSKGKATKSSGDKKPEPRIRSKSSPACLHKECVGAVTQDMQCPGNQYEELEITASKKRPTSEPIRPVPSEEDHIYESPRKLVLRLRRLTGTPPDEQSRKNYEMEGYYASPRSVLAKLDDVITEFSSSDEEQLNNNGGYMSMKELSLAVAEEKRQSTLTDDQLPALHPIKGNSGNPQVTGDSPLKPTPLPRNVKSEKTPKISFLSVVQLSIILGKVTDDTQLQKVDLFFPLGDFTDCLTLTEASGHICVSQWNDPHHLGCIFHQGDYIVAVNDMHVKNTDEISLFTSRSTRKEVKLTIHRLPDSDILHAKGCKCS